MVTLYDVIPMSKNPRAMGIVMQYLDGGNIFDARLKPSVQNKLWAYAEQVLSGLRFLHKNGIIHCDIKPENVMLTQQGGETVAVITDLGMAPLKGQGIGGGFSAYMLHNSAYPAYESEDLFAWEVSLYVIIDDSVLHSISQLTPAFKIDQYIRGKRPDVKDVEIRFAAMKPPFRLNLQSYQTRCLSYR